MEIGISNALAEEKSRLDELIVKVDANYEGLIKEINDIKEELEGQVALAPGSTTGEENGLL